MNRVLKSFFAILSSFFGILFFLILFLLFVGIPTFKDEYVELESKKSEIVVFEDNLANGYIQFRPEVLDRLIVQISFKKKSEKLRLLKYDLEIIDSKSKNKLKQIFDIRVSKPDVENPGFFDEVSLKNDFDELGLNSKYRDLSYIIEPQYDLKGCENFEVFIKLKIQNTSTNQVISIEKEIFVIKESNFKMEKFRVH
jgi:hypothetical protein